MNHQLPWDITADDDDGEKTAPATGAWTGRRLIAVMLLTAAALDLARCGLVLAPARQPVPAAGLAAAGLAAAALTVRTARGCQAGQRWAGWAALLIGAMSAPQAAASGFHAPYTIPDTATAALGILLTVTVLATAGPAGPPRRDTENPCAMDRRATGDPARDEGRSAAGDPARGEGRSAGISDPGSHGQTSLWRPREALLARTIRCFTPSSR
jgi:hypothetical protein